MDTENSTKKSFKDYLDSITNLLTVFGIFNALFIFSTTVEDNTAATFLLPTFFLLSIFIWYELIIYTLKFVDNSKKIEYFFFLMSFIGIGMVWYFIIKFKPIVMFLSIQFSLYLLIVIFAFLFFKITSLLLRKKLTLENDGRNTKLKVLLFFISLIISGIILNYNIKHIVPLLEKIIPDTEKAEDKNK
jgi:hypothetical protein